MRVYCVLPMSASEKEALMVTEKAAAEDRSAQLKSQSTESSSTDITAIVTGRGIQVLTLNRLIREVGERQLTCLMRVSSPGEESCRSRMQRESATGISSTWRMSRCGMSMKMSMSLGTRPHLEPNRRAMQCWESREKWCRAG